MHFDDVDKDLPQSNIISFSPPPPPPPPFFLPYSPPPPPPPPHTHTGTLTSDSGTVAEEKQGNVDKEKERENGAYGEKPICTCICFKRVEWCRGLVCIGQWPTLLFQSIKGCQINLFHLHSSLTHTYTHAQQRKKASQKQGQGRKMVRWTKKTRE